MQPNLQEQMLIRGEVDVSALFTATSYMNLVAAGRTRTRTSAGSTMRTPGSTFIPTA